MTELEKARNELLGDVLDAIGAENATVEVSTHSLKVLLDGYTDLAATAPVSDEELREAMGKCNDVASRYDLISRSEDAREAAAAIRTLLRAVQQEKSCPPALGMLAVRQDLVPDSESTSGYHVENVVVGVEQPEPPADPELVEHFRTYTTMQLEGMRYQCEEAIRRTSDQFTMLPAIRQVLRERGESDGNAG